MDTPRTPPSGTRLKLFTGGHRTSAKDIERWTYVTMPCQCVIGHPPDSPKPTQCPAHPGGK